MGIGKTLILGLCALASTWGLTQAAPAEKVGWKKTVLDGVFRSEGAAVADVNRDGRPDVLVGDFWYESPAQGVTEWKRHEVRQPSELGDGAKNWSKAFACFSDDFNADGWADLLVVGFPGEAALWYENPQNKPGRWKERVASASACNESPQFAELFGDGRKYLVMGAQPEGQMFWFAPNADIEKPWDKRPISVPSTKERRTPGTDRFDHGLGVGDINRDGRADVLVRQGWWEQPADARTRTDPWTWHEATLSSECADMHVVDVDGDGHNDVVSSSAHGKGVWWHQQTPGVGAGWKRHFVDESFSQSHAMVMSDINGDGQRDVVSGKRWWAHGPDGDVDPQAPAVSVWFEIVRDNAAPGGARFEKRKASVETGIGTQFVVRDMNGDGAPDFVVSNKKGVAILEQVRR
jgi:hypothetical protein